MYAGFKRIEPGMDIGVELGEEWGMAERMERGRPLRWTPGNWPGMSRLCRRPPMGLLARGRQDATPPGAAGRWMAHKPAGRPGRGRRRRWATVWQVIMPDLRSRPGGAMKRPAESCGFLACALSGLLGGVDLPPPGIGLLRDYCPRFRESRSRRLPVSLTGTPH